MSFTDKLKDMTLPAHLSDRSVKGVVTGLQIGPGLTVSTFLFEMARTDCNLWCSIEVLTQLCNRSINVKEAKRLIRANRELQVIFFSNWNKFGILEYLEILKFISVGS
jgi:hypothetical protein